MRFTCGNCGRAYVADDRIQGRSFKMPCRRCGQIITVEGALPPAPEAGPPRPVEVQAAPMVQRSEPPPATDEGAPAPRRSRLLPLALVGVGLAAAIGGFAWHLGRPRGPGVAPVAERPPEIAPAPAPTPAPAPVPVPAAPPSVTAEVVEQAPAPVAEPREKRKRPRPPVIAEAPAKVPAVPATVPARPEPAAAPARTPRPDFPPRDEQQIRSTLARYAGSFDGCVADALRDEPALLSSPRPVVVTMTIRPSGQVIYPTLDDAQLSGTALGACVKRQASGMAFPESGGEPVHARMPLLLGR